MNRHLPLPRRLVLAGIAAALMPQAGFAQLAARHLIATLSAGSRTPNWDAFREAMHALGYGDRQIVFESRWAEGHNERLPDLAAELVRLAPQVIVTGSTAAALAAKRATSTIPIVVTFAADPVGSGLAASIGRPGGNVTGLSNIQEDTVGKELELLKAAAPRAARIAVLTNPANPVHVHEWQGAQAAARTLHVELLRTEARGLSEIDAAFSVMANRRADALVVLDDPLLTLGAGRIAELAARRKLPAIYGVREFVMAGGLMSYGPDLKDSFRRGGLRRQDPQRRQAGRSAVRAARQIRFRHQSQSRPPPGSRSASGAARPRRRGHRMRRRELLLSLGAAAIEPGLARAQQASLPVVGYLNAAAPADAADLANAFRQGLSEMHYIEGQNVTIEYRWAESHYDRLPQLAADIVRRQVAVIAATSTPVALAAKNATRTIPIVFTIGGDPVKLGLVSSLSRPGGNLTGVTRYNVELGPKRLQLLHDLVPGARRIGLLMNPSNPNTATLSDTMRRAANALGVDIRLVRAGADSELDRAFEALRQVRAGALAIGNDPFFNSRSGRLAGLTLRHALPAIYQYRTFVEAGGLMSYGASNTESHRQLGVYVGRILAGARPGDLPVEQSTKLDLLINLKTARRLGIAISPLLLARADEVIE